MTTSPDSTASPAGGRWLYPLLLAMQTIGVVIFYWHGLPLYRQLVGDPTTFATRQEIREWALLAIALMQVGYWVGYRVRPVLPRHAKTVLGHIVLFISRLSFLLATSVFSFVFISKKLEGQMSVTSYILTLVGLFSLFCYMQGLQRLGVAFLGQEKKADAPER